MSPNPSPRRGLPVALLLAALVFAGLPIHAQPAQRRLPGIWEVAVSGDAAASWVRDLFARLWMRATTKEGMTIDPDGQKEGVSIDPDGNAHQEHVSIDEGMSIDPNG
jgi:hypothetical protein